MIFVIYPLPNTIYSSQEGGQQVTVYVIMAAIGVAKINANITTTMNRYPIYRQYPNNPKQIKVTK
jgi:predicted NUDIX family NTP pyrophosphohydrolase